MISIHLYGLDITGVKSHPQIMAITPIVFCVRHTMISPLSHVSRAGYHAHRNTQFLSQDARAVDTDSAMRCTQTATLHSHSHTISLHLTAPRGASTGHELPGTGACNSTTTDPAGRETRQGRASSAHVRLPHREQRLPVRGASIGVRKPDLDELELARRARLMQHVALMYLPVQWASGH